jgi:hypothetical protein
MGKLPQNWGSCGNFWKISRVEYGHNCFDLIFGFERENLVCKSTNEVEETHRKKNTT